MKNNTVTTLYWSIFIIFTFFFTAWHGLPWFLRYALSDDSETVMSVSPDHKTKILIKPAISEGFGPSPSVYYQSTRLFAPPAQGIVPHYFIFGYDISQARDFIWDQDSRLFFAWNGFEPIYAYDLNDPDRIFTNFDPYYYKFRLNPVITPEALTEYLIKSAPEHLNSFFFIAIRERKIDMLQKLIDHGVDIDHENWNNQTPLIYAVEQENPDIVRFLLANGADKKKFNINRKRENPLDIAQRLKKKYKPNNKSIDLIIQLLQEDIR